MRPDIEGMKWGEGWHGLTLENQKKIIAYVAELEAENERLREVERVVREVHRELLPEVSRNYAAQRSVHILSQVLAKKEGE